MMNVKNGPSSYKTDSKSYRALMSVLVRQKSKYDSEKTSSTDKPVGIGKLASYYCDAFVVCAFEIRSETAEEQGMCGPKQFTNWRDQQKKLGNLDWDVTVFRGKNGKDWHKYTYRPGKKIAEQIVKIANEHGLSATKGYVDSKIAALEERLTMVEAGLDILIEKFDPPITDEKRTEYYPNPSILISRWTKNIVGIVEENEREMRRKFPDYDKYINQIEN